MATNNKKQLFSTKEITILRFLSEKLAPVKEREGLPLTEISEISVETGIRDKDEVLRALYTLEGKSLVEPHPMGDFTSNQWKITDIGVRALSIVL